MKTIKNILIIISVICGIYAVWLISTIAIIFLEIATLLLAVVGSISLIRLINRKQKLRAEQA